VFKAKVFNVQFTCLDDIIVYSKTIFQAIQPTQTKEEKAILSNDSFRM